MIDHAHDALAAGHYFIEDAADLTGVIAHLPNSIIARRVLDFTARSLSLGALALVWLGQPATASEDSFLFPQIKRAESLTPDAINAVRRFDAALDREQAVGPRQRALNQNVATRLIECLITDPIVLHSWAIERIALSNGDGERQAPAFLSMASHLQRLDEEKNAKKIGECIERACCALIGRKKARDLKDREARLIFLIDFLAGRDKKATDDAIDLLSPRVRAKLDKGQFARYQAKQFYLTPLPMVPVTDKDEDQYMHELDRLIVLSDDLRKLAYIDRPFTDDWIDEQLRFIDRIAGKPELDFKVALLLNSLAYTKKIDGRLPEAIACFKRALAILQGDGDVHRDLLSAITYDIGESYYWQGNTTQALHYMQCALNFSGTLPDIGKATMMSRICINAGRGHEAREILVRYKSLLGLDDILKPDLQKVHEDKAYAANVDSVLQEYADASIATSDYDEALAADQVLIRLRSMREDRDGLMGAIWQAAYVEQCMGGQANRDAVVHYSLLIDEYGALAEQRPRPLADWLLARAQLHDLLGQNSVATRDFRKARLWFKRAYREMAKSKKDDSKVWDQDQFDRLGWTIDDIDYNLTSRKKSPESDGDYLQAEPVYKFDLAKTPVLRVYVDDTRAHGFSGALRDLVLQNILRWSDFEGSPIKLEFVNAVDDAQIYVERVMSYDDIPYSSAGRTTASYVEGRPDLLFRTHIKVFCRAADFESQDGNHKDTNMSSFAREALATLVAHEFGHALGLGHSPGGLDMMYWKTQSKDLSLRDRKTIQRLYGP